MRDPRSARIFSSGSDNRFSCDSPNLISPSALACGASNRIIASDVTDFPEPDSPTSPSTSPEPIEKLTSRTAWTDRDCPLPATVAKLTFSSRTSKSGVPTPLSYQQHYRVAQPTSAVRPFDLSFYFVLSAPLR